jgi:phosphorylcholine metabolism protein LicD
MIKHENAKKTIEYVKEQFQKVELDFWLEAGTALAAVRDGKVFDWEHDIDLGVWREDLDKVLSLLENFKIDGCKIKVQKGLPLIDNIIQVFLPDDKDGVKPFPDQLDIYLFTRKGDYAYMRWLQKPEGAFASFKKKAFIISRNFITGDSKITGPLGDLFPMPFKLFFYKIFLKIYINNSTCIYHRFPKAFFMNLKHLDFYGVEVNIASDTDKYLSYRYGENWKTPDKEFNQTGKWKKSEARVLLKMSELSFPEINSEYLKLSNV